MFKLMINLLKFVKEREKSTKDAQSVKTKGNLMDKIKFGGKYHVQSTYSLFLNSSPFSVFNFNFD
jgi:butyrate kinase